MRMGVKYMQTQHRCRNSDCKWTDFDPVDLKDGNWLCAECNGQFPLDTFQTRSVQRETQD